MGMYTEIFISARIKEDTPEDVLYILKYLFNDGLEPSKLPEHAFFSTERWRSVGTSSSCYFVPFASSKMVFDTCFNQWFITSRSDLKNYDQEIEKFFEWVMPYIDEPAGQFIGYSRYEEDDKPTLYYKKDTLDGHTALELMGNERND